MLTVKKINKGCKDLDKVKHLYETAFPKDEKIPFYHIYTGRNLALAFYDTKTFVGFVSLLFHQDIISIAYFAIESDQRNHGYGSQVLQQLFQMYPDHRLYVDIEKEDKTADNATQRYKRKQFYLRNDFQLMDFMYTWNHVTYEVLVYPSSINEKELLAFWSHFTKFLPTII